MELTSDNKKRRLPSTSPTTRSSGAPPAARGRGSSIVGTGVRSFPVEEVGTYGGVAVRGEPPSDLLSGLVPSRHVVDDHHAAARRLVQRAGGVRFDGVVVTRGDGDGLGDERVSHLAFSQLKG